ncbi:unnamed protein product [Nippostrongylus brasiliensis]|uniref:Sulfotransfer_1 domain-containing protein n=1 Tax=Nippostrongylus brasiliensis TaxID=27835 RepID=A0A0N4XZF1_NIPBR|nr:unnamed protein product [Nippostrongylus brasiliensis]
MLPWLLHQLLLMASVAAVPVEIPQKMFPTAIIVGVKKGGTRALLEFLRLNPNIRAPRQEVHFFDRNYNKGLEWYRSQMPLVTNGQVTIEKSPAYFHSRTAPERIRAFNPSMKIIIVVRNPVMRAISDYTQSASKRRTIGEMPSFEDMAVGNCAPWLKTNCSSKVDGVNIHIVDGERLVADPAAEVATTERFLGLESVVQANNFAVNPVKKFPCVRHPDATLHCLGKTKGRTHPRVRRSVLHQLRRFYAPENEKFFRLINRSLIW